MYIPEFWCGVVTVLIVETIALISAAIWFGKKTQKNERKCGDCPLADKELYLTDPSMKKCSLTNQFHTVDHKCNV